MHYGRFGKWRKKRSFNLSSSFSPTRDQVVLSSKLVDGRSQVQFPVMLVILAMVRINTGYNPLEKLSQRASHLWSQDPRVGSWPQT